jgi:excisionase family DNA binding protein
MSTLPEKDLLTVDEVAEYFTITTKTVYRWIEKGALISIKVGGIIRIPRNSLFSDKK